jgi:Bacterial Ig domain/RTX calcium-binding nonapeptide repeat (4 copies)
MVNVAPIAVDDVFAVTQGQTLTGNLGADNGSGDTVDGDPDGSILGFVPTTFSPIANESAGYFGAYFSNGVLTYSFMAGTVSYPQFVIATSTAIITQMGGTVILQTNGNFTYTAPAGYFGPDSFDYKLYDGEFATDIGHVDINVADSQAINDKPVAYDDVFGTDEDVQLIGNVLLDNDNGADMDPNGDALTVNAQTFFTANGGLVVMKADGSFTYMPKANYSGEDAFNYVVKDPSGASDMAIVRITVGATNDDPTAVNDVYYGVHSQPITGNVLGNDSDADGDTLSVGEGEFTTANGGTVTINADGTFTYDPNTAFVGTDSFVYTVEDGHGGSDTATVTLNVTNTNPIARTDYFNTGFGQSKSLNILTNDSDADGDSLTIVDTTITTAQGVNITLAADGSFTYQPPEYFYGADSFTYEVSDGFGGTASALAIISVAAPLGMISGDGYENIINGTSGADYIVGLGEDDTLYGKDGNDIILGGADDDAINGDGGNDMLLGEAGRDTLQGGTGNDTLKGGADADTLSGGEGVDWLYGGAGLDKLTGGNGNDVFVFGAADATSKDRISDFKTGDKLAFAAADYDLDLGALPDASYLAKTGAANVDHGRFLYDSASRTLSWDDDGMAATANIAITTFDKSVNLTLSDFMVI